MDPQITQTDTQLDTQDHQLDLPKYLEWTARRGVRLSDSVAVGPSELGGLGLLAKRPIEKDTIVLRVPAHSAYNLGTLLEIISQAKTEDSGFASAAVRAVSECQLTESIIVRNFVWALAMIKADREANKLELGSIEAIGPYLELLLATPVLDYDAGPELEHVTEPVARALVREKQRVRADHAAIIKAVDSLEQLFPFGHAWRLHQAVKSRVLEVPHAAESADPDYETSITLVPVLDFANHLENYNAVFDVDEGDIVLRTTQPVSGEICIHYGDTSAELFLRTYGFVPGECQVEFCPQQGLSGSDLMLHKWLRVTPLSFGPHGVDVGPWPLLYIPGIQYSANWLRDSAALAREFGCDTDQEVAAIVAELTRQEQHDATIEYPGETVFGVVANGTRLCRPRAVPEIHRAATLAGAEAALASLHSQCPSARWPALALYYAVRDEMRRRYGAELRAQAAAVIEAHIE